MIYELRIYHCVPGRLPALLKRFETTTLKIWERHGIRQAGFWTVMVGERQPRSALSARLGIARRARAELEQVRDRSGVGRSAPKARRTARSSPRSTTCSCSRPHSRRSVKAGRWHAASTISFMRCVTSTQPPIFYRRLGFTVGARNRHPWGTHNHIVQLPGFFIELVTVAEPEKMRRTRRASSRSAVQPGFPGARRGLLAAGARKPRCASPMRAAFSDAGIGDFEPFEFEREGKRPDGSPIKVGFSLAFARDPRRAQTSASSPASSTIRRISGIRRSRNTPTERPASPASSWSPTIRADHHIFLSAFTGERELHATSLGMTVQTPRGEMQIISPYGFSDLFGVAPPDLSRGGARGGTALAVSKDVVGTAATLTAAHIAFADHTRAALSSGQPQPWARRWCSAEQSVITSLAARRPRAGRRGPAGGQRERG